MVKKGGWRGRGISLEYQSPKIFWTGLPKREYRLLERNQMQETYVSFKNMVLYKKDLYEEERIKLKRKRTLSIHLVYSMYLHRIVGKECE